ncbi:MAG: phenylalanine--tRNA ligase subunit beta [Faecalibacterium sp.]
MKVPFSWLKEYVDIDVTAQELEAKLFSCGFEVEELIDLSAGIDKVVVGKVVEMEQQEGTHLYKCVVDCGDYGHDIRISTGAPNVFVGAHVPAALDGSTLPGGIKIKARKMQGVESNGMLCSGEELGLNDDLYPGAEVYGLLILPEDTVPGEDICPVVGLNDYIFDISITANRPDCQSVLGIAREVAAILHKPLKMPATDYTAVMEPDAPILVAVEAPDLCPRYMAHYVRNIRMGESPRWMKRHLALCGLHSISNVVDITNHTLLEMGQPMHAFDLNKVAGRSITVRRAHPGEKIVTLDEKEFSLTENNLVICDAEKPVALAGIMGGANSGMDENTTSLLFECATFARDSVRKTGRALGQSSDSSARYEKGVDRSSPALGLARALHLIQELNCGDITTLEYDLTDGRLLERKTIVTTPAKICGVLGITVPEQEMIDILQRLEFTVEVQPDGQWIVRAPLYREDVESFPDLAEEVIREYGYDHIVPTFLKTAAVTNGGLNPAQKQQMKVKRMLAAQGFYEASTLAFYSQAELDQLHIPADDASRKAIRILNPISENLSIMRTLLVPSMLHVIVDNLKKGCAEGRLFELAPVYLAKSLPITEHPQERQTLCLGAFGPQEDFFTVKGALEMLASGFGLSFTYEREANSWLHPGICAAVFCGGKRIGVFGKLANEINAELDIPKEQKANQNIYLAELDYETLMSCVEGELRYHPLSPFAPIHRDLALVCDEAVTCGSIEETIRKASPLVTEVKLFDIYRGKNLGEGKKSMAFSLTLSDPRAEVSAEVVERTVKKILGNLKFKLGAEIR